MTSKNDGKEVKNATTSTSKGKSPLIEIYKSLERTLTGDGKIAERGPAVVSTWSELERLCEGASSTGARFYLLQWAHSRSAAVVLQSEWQSPSHVSLRASLDGVLATCSKAAGAAEWQVALASWARSMRRLAAQPWDHAVLRALLDKKAEQPTDDDVVDWLIEDRGSTLVARLRQLTSVKCDDLALQLASAVTTLLRASAPLDAENQTEGGTATTSSAGENSDVKKQDLTGIPSDPGGAKGQYMERLRENGGYSEEVVGIIQDAELVLLHKSGNMPLCIKLLKSWPLDLGATLVRRVSSRAHHTKSDKKLWKHAKQLATLAAQVLIARCMVAPVLNHGRALYELVRLVAHLGGDSASLHRTVAALTAPADTAEHIRIAARAIVHQCGESMRPLTCELYVRALTASMNELERAKLSRADAPAARLTERALAVWLLELAEVLSGNARVAAECTLTAFSVHPSAELYKRVGAACLEVEKAGGMGGRGAAKTDEDGATEWEMASSEQKYSSWAGDSRPTHTKLVKTSTTSGVVGRDAGLGRHDVVSAAVLDGDGLGLSPDLCQDLAILLGGPRVKTLTWDKEREELLENCRAYMMATEGGTQAVITELKYLHLDPDNYAHLPCLSDDDDENQAFYGIERGYEHHLEQEEAEENSPENMLWETGSMFSDLEETFSRRSSVDSDYVSGGRLKKRDRHRSDGDGNASRGASRTRTARSFSAERRADSGSDVRLSKAKTKSVRKTSGERSKKPRAEKKRREKKEKKKKEAADGGESGKRKGKRKSQKDSLPAAEKSVVLVDGEFSMDDGAQVYNADRLSPSGILQKDVLRLEEKPLSAVFKNQIPKLEGSQDRPLKVNPNLDAEVPSKMNASPAKLSTPMMEGDTPPIHPLVHLKLRQTVASSAENVRRPTILGKSPVINSLLSFRREKIRPSCSSSTTASNAASSFGDMTVQSSSSSIRVPSNDLDFVSHSTNQEVTQSASKVREAKFIETLLSHKFSTLGNGQTNISPTKSFNVDQPPPASNVPESVHRINQNHNLKSLTKGLDLKVSLTTSSDGGGRKKVVKRPSSGESPIRSPLSGLVIKVVNSESTKTKSKTDKLLPKPKVQDVAKTAESANRSLLIPLQVNTKSERHSPAKMLQTPIKIYNLDASLSPTKVLNTLSPPKQISPSLTKCDGVAQNRQQTSQASYENFLKELKATINAGAAADSKPSAAAEGHQKIQSQALDKSMACDSFTIKSGGISNHTITQQKLREFLVQNKKMQPTVDKRDQPNAASANKMSVPKTFARRSYLKQKVELAKQQSSDIQPAGISRSNLSNSSLDDRLQSGQTKETLGDVKMKFNSMMQPSFLPPNLKCFRTIGPNTPYASGGKVNSEGIKSMVASNPLMARMLDSNSLQVHLVNKPKSATAPEVETHSTAKSIVSSNVANSVPQKGKETSQPYCNLNYSLALNSPIKSKAPPTQPNRPKPPSKKRTTKLKLPLEFLKASDAKAVKCILGNEASPPRMTKTDVVKSAGDCGDEKSQNAWGNITFRGKPFKVNVLRNRRGPSTSNTNARHNVKATPHVVNTECDVLKTVSVEDGDGAVLKRFNVKSNVAETNLGHKTKDETNITMLLERLPANLNVVKVKPMQIDSIESKQDTPPINVEPSALPLGIQHKDEVRVTKVNNLERIVENEQGQNHNRASVEVEALLDEEIDKDLLREIDELTSEDEYIVPASDQPPDAGPKPSSTSKFKTGNLWKASFVSDTERVGREMEKKNGHNDLIESKVQPKITTNRINIMYPVLRKRVKIQNRTPHYRKSLYPAIPMPWKEESLSEMVENGQSKVNLTKENLSTAKHRRRTGHVKVGPKSKMAQFRINDECDNTETKESITEKINEEPEVAKSKSTEINRSEDAVQIYKLAEDVEPLKELKIKFLKASLATHLVGRRQKHLVGRCMKDVIDQRLSTMFNNIDEKTDNIGVIDGAKTEPNEAFDIIEGEETDLGQEKVDLNLSDPTYSASEAPNAEELSKEELPSHSGYSLDGISRKEDTSHSVDEISKEEDLANDTFSSATVHSADKISKKEALANKEVSSETPKAEEASTIFSAGEPTEVEELANDEISSQGYAEAEFQDPLSGVDELCVAARTRSAQKDCSRPMSDSPVFKVVEIPKECPAKVATIKIKNVKRTKTVNKRVIVVKKNKRQFRRKVVQNKGLDGRSELLARKSIKAWRKMVAAKKKNIQAEKPMMLRSAKKKVDADIGIAADLSNKKIPVDLAIDKKEVAPKVKPVDDEERRDIGKAADLSNEKIPVDLAIDKKEVATKVKPVEDEERRDIGIAPDLSNKKIPVDLPIDKEEVAPKVNSVDDEEKDESGEDDVIEIVDGKEVKYVQKPIDGPLINEELVCKFMPDIKTLVFNSTNRPNVKYIATIRGHQNLDINDLTPLVKQKIMQQIRETNPNKPIRFKIITNIKDKLMINPFSLTSGLKPKIPNNVPAETIDLISDDDEEGSSKASDNNHNLVEKPNDPPKFGNWNVIGVSNEIFTKYHVSRLNQECRVTIARRHIKRESKNNHIGSPEKKVKISTKREMDFLVATHIPKSKQHPVVVAKNMPLEAIRNFLKISLSEPRKRKGGTKLMPGLKSISYLRNIRRNKPRTNIVNVKEPEIVEIIDLDDISRSHVTKSVIESGDVLNEASVQDSLRETTPPLGGNGNFHLADDMMSKSTPESIDNNKPLENNQKENLQFFRRITTTTVENKEESSQGELKNNQGFESNERMYDESSQTRNTRKDNAEGIIFEDQNDIDTISIDEIPIRIEETNHDTCSENENIEIREFCSQTNSEIAESNPTYTSGEEIENSDLKSENNSDDTNLKSENNSNNNSDFIYSFQNINQISKGIEDLSSINTTPLETVNEDTNSKFLSEEVSQIDSSNASDETMDEYKETTKNTRDLKATAEQKDAEDNNVEKIVNEKLHLNSSSPSEAIFRCEERDVTTVTFEEFFQKPDHNELKQLDTDKENKINENNISTNETSPIMEAVDLTMSKNVMPVDLHSEKESSQAKFSVDAPDNSEEVPIRDEKTREPTSESLDLCVDGNGEEVNSEEVEEVDSEEVEEANSEEVDDTNDTRREPDVVVMSPEDVVKDTHEEYEEVANEHTKNSSNVDDFQLRLETACGCADEKFAPDNSERVHHTAVERTGDENSVTECAADTITSRALDLCLTSSHIYCDEVEARQELDKFNESPKQGTKDPCVEYEVRADSNNSDDLKLSSKNSEETLKTDEKSVFESEVSTMTAESEHESCAGIEDATSRTGDGIQGPNVCCLELESLPDEDVVEDLPMNLITGLEINKIPDINPGDVSSIETVNAEHTNDLTKTNFNTSLERGDTCVIKLTENVTEDNENIIQVSFIETIQKKQDLETNDDMNMVHLNQEVEAEGLDSNSGSQIEIDDHIILLEDVTKVINEGSRNLIDRNTDEDSANILEYEEPQIYHSKTDVEFLTHDKSSTFVKPIDHRTVPVHKTCLSDANRSDSMNIDNMNIPPQIENPLDDDQETQAVQRIYLYQIPGQGIDQIKHDTITSLRQPKSLLETSMDNIKELDAYIYSATKQSCNDRDTIITEDEREPVAIESGDSDQLSDEINYINDAQTLHIESNEEIYEPDCQEHLEPELCEPVEIPLSAGNIEFVLKTREEEINQCEKKDIVQSETTSEVDLKEYESNVSSEYTDSLEMLQEAETLEMQDADVNKFDSESESSRPTEIPTNLDRKELNKHTDQDNVNNWATEDTSSIITNENKENNFSHNLIGKTLSDSEQSSEIDNLESAVTPDVDDKLKDSGIIEGRLDGLDCEDVESNLTEEGKVDEATFLEVEIMEPINEIDNTLDAIINIKSEDETDETTEETAYSINIPKSNGTKKRMMNSGNHSPKTVAESEVGSASIIVTDVVKIEEFEIKVEPIDDENSLDQLGNDDGVCRMPLRNSRKRKADDKIKLNVSEDNGSSAQVIVADGANVSCESSVNSINCVKMTEKSENSCKTTAPSNSNNDFNDVNIYTAKLPRRTYTHKKPGIPSMKRKLISSHRLPNKKFRKGNGIDLPTSSKANIDAVTYRKEILDIEMYNKAVALSDKQIFSRAEVDLENVSPFSFYREQENIITFDADVDNNSSTKECKFLFEDPSDKSELAERDTSCSPIFCEDGMKLVHDHERADKGSEEEPILTGFGEVSDRVITSTTGRKNAFPQSAATLSDVKQQPHRTSEDSENDRNTHNGAVGHNLLSKLRDYFKKNPLGEQTSNNILKPKVMRTRADFDYKPKLHVHTKHISKLLYLLTDVPGLDSFNYIQPTPNRQTVQVVQVGQLPVTAAPQNPSQVTCNAVDTPDETPVSQCNDNATRHEETMMNASDFSELNETAKSDEARDATNLIDSTHEVGGESAHISLDERDSSDANDHVNVDALSDHVQETDGTHNHIGESAENPVKCFENEVSSMSGIQMKYDETVTVTEHGQNVNSSTMFSADTPVQIVFTSPMHQNNFSQAEIGANKDVSGFDKNEHVSARINSAMSSQVNRAQALVNMLSQKLVRSPATTANTHSTVSAAQSKPAAVTTMSLQQALAQILPPPLSQSSSAESPQQNSITPQVLHFVQGKSTPGNQITLVDNGQQSVLNSHNAQVLHIVQNKSATNHNTSNNVHTPVSNAFGGISLVDTGLQQGGNQVLHIVNTGNQAKMNATAQLLKRVNLLTSLTNVQGANEQKMVQFVCKSADGKSIQLNAPHQRSMVLRLQPIETPASQNAKTQDGAPPNVTVGVNLNKKSPQPDLTQQEIKSRSVYEENYAKFIQNSTNKTPAVPSEKSTSLPKFNQAFGKAIFQDATSTVKASEGDQENIPLTNISVNVNDNSDQSTAETTQSMSVGQAPQLSNPPLLIRKSQPTAQQNLVQQLKQTIAPMNIQTMHGGVIYTRQIPVNIGGGQTINLITVPSTELIDDGQKTQEIKFTAPGEGLSEQPIIKIIPQSQQAMTEATSEELNQHAVNADGTSSQAPAQPLLTQMRIKLPMLTKTPQVVPGARVVRPFLQIQRNVIAGTNQPVYQQLLLTTTPQLAQQNIRLPQMQSTRQVKVPAQNQASESNMSTSTLEQLREFDMVLEQVKERSTVQPNAGVAFANVSPQAAEVSPEASNSTLCSNAPREVLYSIGANQTVNVTYVNQKVLTSISGAATYTRTLDTSVVASSTSQISHSLNSPQGKSSNGNISKVASKSVKSKTSKPVTLPPAAAPKPSVPVPPKTSIQKPLEDEQTTQRILYILAEYKEQVENSPDKDKPAPRRRSNPPTNPSSSSKRKKSSGGSSKKPNTGQSLQELSPVGGVDDPGRTMGSEDSSCGLSQGECPENGAQSLDGQSPQGSPQKVARKILLQSESEASNGATSTPQPRNVIIADGQAIAVARPGGGKAATAVLMPANYLLPVSMVKGGQQITIVTNQGPKLLTVPQGEGGANALLLQRLVSPAGLKPMLTRPGIRHVRLPTFGLASPHTITPANRDTLNWIDNGTLGSTSPKVLMEYTPNVTVGTDLASDSVVSETQSDVPSLRGDENASIGGDSVDANATIKVDIGETQNDEVLTLQHNSSPSEGVFSGQSERTVDSASTPSHSNAAADLLMQCRERLNQPSTHGPSLNLIQVHSLGVGESQQKLFSVQNAASLSSLLQLASKSSGQTLQSINLHSATDLEGKASQEIQESGASVMFVRKQSLEEAQASAEQGHEGVKILPGLVTRGMSGTIIAVQPRVSEKTVGQHELSVGQAASQESHQNERLSVEQNTTWRLVASSGNNNTPSYSTFVDSPMAVTHEDRSDHTGLGQTRNPYSPDATAHQLFDKMFDASDTKKVYVTDLSHNETLRVAHYEASTSHAGCDDKPFIQNVGKKQHEAGGGSFSVHTASKMSTQQAATSAAALRHKYAILEHELRLQKSLSEECEDLGVDSPSASELFPEAELLFAASPAHLTDHSQDAHPAPPLLAATPQALSELEAQLEAAAGGAALDAEEFARAHPNTTFHSELPDDEGEVQPYTISGGAKTRHVYQVAADAQPTHDQIKYSVPELHGMLHTAPPHQLSAATFELPETNVAQVIHRNPHFLMHESGVGESGSVDSSVERHSELFWDTNSNSNQSEPAPAPLRFSSECSNDSDSVIKETDGSSSPGAEDTAQPPLRTYLSKRSKSKLQTDDRNAASPHSMSESSSSDGPMALSKDTMDAVNDSSRSAEQEPGSARRRTSVRGVVKRGCLCCNGSPAPSKPKKPRQKKSSNAADYGSGS